MTKVPGMDAAIGRRAVLKKGLVTSAGLVALAGVGISTDAAAKGIVDPIDPQDDQELKVPPGLKKNAQIDPRYQISYRRSVPAACRVLTAHFDAIAQRDYAALGDTFHFPFAIVEKIDPVVVNSPSELTDARAPMSLNFSPNGQLNTDHFSRLEPGAYDMLISLEVINFDPVHANMAMTFDRYNRHGFRTLRCEGVYCVTNNDGKWAIQLMSTIWTPDNLVGHVYAAAMQAAIRNRINHNLSYVDDNDVIDRPRPSRGVTVSITGGGIGRLFESQQGNDPLDQFRIKGIKSRLGVRKNNNPLASAIDPINRRAPQEPHINKNDPIVAEFAKQGDNYYEGITVPATRIIHQAGDKVHRYSGVTRYTAAGEEISTSMEVAVVVLGTEAEWTDVAMFRYVTMHDRNNDDRT